jgi:hypothetical protein
LGVAPVGGAVELDEFAVAPLVVLFAVVFPVVVPFADDAEPPPLAAVELVFWPLLARWPELPELPFWPEVPLCRALFGMFPVGDGAAGCATGVEGGGATCVGVWTPGGAADVASSQSENDGALSCCGTADSSAC